MSRPLLSRIPKQNLSPLVPCGSEPPCPICGKPVPLETANTDENGAAVHEQCYVLKLESERARS